MKPYKTTIAVTTKYTVEVHGEDEHIVQETAEKMDSVQIANAGDIVAGDDAIEVLDIELLYPENYEEEEVVESEPEPKPDDKEDERRLIEEEKFVDLDSLKASDPVEGEEDTDVS